MDVKVEDGLPGIALSTAAVHAIGAAYIFRSLSHSTKGRALVG